MGIPVIGPIESKEFYLRIGLETYFNKISPFFLKYNREPTLTNDVNHNLVDIEKKRLMPCFQLRFPWE